MTVGINNIPLSPALSSAGFRAIACGPSDEDCECACCSRLFPQGAMIYWSDGGFYGDSAEAHCRRCAFDYVLRSYAEPLITFYTLGWKKPKKYSRRTIKAYYRPDPASRQYFNSHKGFSQ